MRAELVAILALVFRQVLHITTGALQKNGLRTHSPGASIGSNSFGHSTQRTHPSFSNLSTGDACLSCPGHSGASGSNPIVKVGQYVPRTSTAPLQTCGSGVRTDRGA